jgi:hypothetical protein
MIPLVATSPAPVSIIINIRMTFCNDESPFEAEITLKVRKIDLEVLKRKVELKNG